MSSRVKHITQDAVHRDTHYIRLRFSRNKNNVLYSIYTFFPSYMLLSFFSSQAHRILSNLIYGIHNFYLVRNVHRIFFFFYRPVVLCMLFFISFGDTNIAFAYVLDKRFENGFHMAAKPLAEKFKEIKLPFSYEHKKEEFFFFIICTNEIQIIWKWHKYFRCKQIYKYDKHLIF